MHARTRPISFPAMHSAPPPQGRSGHALVVRVERFIRRHEMLRSGDTALVAVSGGPDSVALLDLLRTIAPSWNLRLVVCHLDHQLRQAESARDACFVAQLADTLGLTSEIGQCDIAEMARREKIGLEEAGRKARYEFFEQVRLRYGASRTVLGHTADDQVETVLHHLLRGSGLRGMGGMAAVRDTVLIRPLLEVWRSEILQYLDDRGISFRLDASNSDPAFVRNRIRLKLVPRIREEFGFGACKAIQRLATTAMEDKEYLEAEASRLADRLLQSRPDGSIVCRVSELMRLPAALRRRVLMRAFQQCRPAWDSWEFAHIEQVLGLAEPGRSGKSLRLPQGIYIARQFDLLVFSSQAAVPAGPFEYRLPIPGKLVCAEGGWELSASSGSGIPSRQRPSRENSLSAHLLPSAGEEELLIRSFRNGDRWRPDSRKKVKESWNLFKVPRRLRSRIPLVFSGSRLLWIPGLPPPHHAVAAGVKGVHLELRFDPESALGYWLANAAERLNCGAPNPLI